MTNWLSITIANDERPRVRFAYCAGESGRHVAGAYLTASNMMFGCSLIGCGFIRPVPPLFRIMWNTRHLHRFRK